MKASYLELYKERITDLLGPADGPELQLREDVRTGVYVEGLTEREILNGVRLQALNINQADCVIWTVLAAHQQVLSGTFGQYCGLLHEVHVRMTAYLQTCRSQAASACGTSNLQHVVLMPAAL